MPKYLNDEVSILRKDLYSEVFERKGVKFLKIRRTADFAPLKDLEVPILEEHIWSYGDSLHKLSTKAYGTIEHWWSIGIVNKKPTDAHYKIGDVVYIPSNPYSIKERLR